MAEQNTTVSVLGKLSKFDGKQVNTFLKNFEKRAIIEKWNETDKASLLTLVCSGNAEVFIDSLPNLKEMNYEQLKKALKDRFSQQISKAQAYAALMGVRQARKDIEEYIAEIESLAFEFSDVISDLRDSSLRDELLVSVFLNGVEVNIKKILSANEYSSFSDVCRAAKKCEATSSEGRRTVNLVEEKSNSTQSPTDRTIPAHFPMYNKPPSEGCYECGEFGHIRRYCPYRTHQYNPNYHYRGRGYGRGMPANRGRGMGMPPHMNRFEQKN